MDLVMGVGLVDMFFWVRFIFGVLIKLLFRIGGVLILFLGFLICGGGLMVFWVLCWLLFDLFGFLCGELIFMEIIDGFVLVFMVFLIVKLWVVFEFCWLFEVVLRELLFVSDLVFNDFVNLLMLVLCERLELWLCVVCCSDFWFVLFVGLSMGVFIYFFKMVVCWCGKSVVCFLVVVLGDCGWVFGWLVGLLCGLLSFIEFNWYIFCWIDEVIFVGFLWVMFKMLK